MSMVVTRVRDDESLARTLKERSPLQSYDAQTSHEQAYYALPSQERVVCLIQLRKPLLARVREEGKL